MSTYDQFREAGIIADKIEKDGFNQQAEEVRSAISNGRSGTEVFMQIRFYLSPLIKRDEINLSTRVQIKILVDNLNEALSK
jgi:hypothetical protein